jgi:aminopeptidase N
MTDSLAALSELSHTDFPERKEVLNDFYNRWKGNRLVIDKWFSIQAMSRRASTMDDVIGLTAHADFELSNPNRVRSLVSAFAMSNSLIFNDKNGRGYSFLADYIIKLDKLNPQLAARMCGPLSRWKKFDKQRQTLMLSQLQRIVDTTGLSPDVYEIVSKTLDAKKH